MLTATSPTRGDWQHDDLRVPCPTSGCDAPAGGLCLTEHFIPTIGWRFTNATHMPRRMAAWKQAEQGGHRCNDKRVGVSDLIGYEVRP